MPAALANLDFPAALSISLVGSVGVTAFGLASGYLIERMFRDRRVYDIAKKPDQLRKEVLGNVLWHLLWCPVFALTLASGWLNFGEGIVREVLTFLGCVYAFQGVYYLFHRAMHHKSLMFMHRWHHYSLVTTPMTGFSIHPLEGLGWCVCFLGPALLASAFTEIGAYGFFAFVAFAWVGNIIGHANAEYMPKVAATHAYSRVVSNPITYHLLHHGRFKGHYGFATSWADALGNTQFPDWIAVAKQVQAGQAMRKFNERVEPAESAE